MGFVGNSVSAKNIYQLFPVSIDKTHSDLDQNYQVWILNKARFNTMYLWTVINTITMDNTFSVFWASQSWFSNLYYINTDSTYYSSLKNSQWFFQYYYSCDKIDLTTSWDYLTGCWSPMQYVPWDEIITNFLSTIKVDTDYVYVYSRESTELHMPIYILDVCFSSSELDSTLCFYWRFNSSYPFTWSLNIPYDYSFLTLRNYTAESPAFSPNIDWWSQDVSPGQITWNTMDLKCTKRNALLWYTQNHYNNNMCYSQYSNNTDIFSGGVNYSAWFDNPWTDIWSIYLATKEYRRYWQTSTALSYSDWFDYWRKSYEVYKKNSDNGLSNPFQWVPVSLFTLMWFVDTYALPYSNASVLEYCDFAIYSDWIDLSDAYTWIASEYVCSNLDLIVNWTVNSSGEVAVWDSWIGITNRPGYNTPPVGAWWNENSYWTWWSSVSTGDTYSDWKTFQNNFFNLLSSTYRFATSTWEGGILPSYIIIALCCLIFFRFLRH